MRATCIYFCTGAFYRELFITMYGTYIWFFDEFRLLYHEIRCVTELSKFVYPTYTSLQRFSVWVHSTKFLSIWLAGFRFVCSAPVSSRTYAYLLRHKHERCSLVWEMLVDQRKIDEKFTFFAAAVSYAN
jgi:hypothetical protein